MTFPLTEMLFPSISSNVIAVRSRKDRDGGIQGKSATTSHGPVSAGIFSGALPFPTSHQALVSSLLREADHQVSTSNIAQRSSQLVGPIPLPGPTIQAAVETLLTTIKTIDIHHHHMGVKDGLASRLSQLCRYLRNAPTARDDIEQYRRNEVASEMQSTSDKLRKLDKRSIFVKQTIIGCSGKLQQYLDDYKFGIPDPDLAAHVPGVVTSGSLILVDATGHQHEIPFEFGMSLRQLNRMLELFFTGESREARIQRHYMEQGQYDLCIDQGTQITVLESQGNAWPTMEPGRKIVMRVIIEKEPEVRSPIQCDSCGCSDFSMHLVHMNNGSAGWTLHCQKCEQRHQFSVGRETSFHNTNILPQDETGQLICNKHIREIPVELQELEEQEKELQLLQQQRDQRRRELQRQEDLLDLQRIQQKEGEFRLQRQQDEERQLQSEELQQREQRRVDIFLEQQLLQDFELRQRRRERKQQTFLERQLFADEEPFRQLLPPQELRRARERFLHLREEFLEELSQEPCHVPTSRWG